MVARRVLGQGQPPLQVTLTASDVVEDRSFSFGRRRVLQSIGFELSDGVTGLLGENGAGKTTLLRILSGRRVARDAGRLVLDGNCTTDRPLAAAESAVRRGTILAYGAMVGLGQLPAAVLGAEALAMRCFLAGSGLLLATAALVGTTYWRGLGGLVTSVFGIVWLILGGAMAS